MTRKSPTSAWRHSISSTKTTSKIPTQAYNLPCGQAAEAAAADTAAEAAAAEAVAASEPAVSEAAAWEAAEAAA
jgi:hypothetical protein